MRRHACAALALALAVLSAQPAHADSNRRRPTYPFSRLITSKFNPFTWFGLERFIDARGFLGRAKTGRMSGQDVLSVRRLLMAKYNMTKDKAEQVAEKLKKAAKQKASSYRGKQYVLSRFLTSHLARGGVALVAVAASAVLSGFAAVAALVYGLWEGMRVVGGVWFDRAVATRGLAGRVALDSKSLMGPEEEYLEFIAAGLEQ